MKKTVVKLVPTAVCAGLLLVSGASGLTNTPTDFDYRDASENVFLGEEVTVVEVTMNPSDFQDILDNPESDNLKNCTVRWYNSVIDETLNDVGIRARGGNYTRGATRKSYLLDFNDFVPDRAFHGLEAADLNGDHNDPTMMRRRLAHEFLRRMGLPSPRTHYVAFYVNGTFRSIKIHTEKMDEEFADSWFGSKDGNLYKCVYKDAPADLHYISNDPNAYKNYGNGKTYEEKNNDPLSDYTDLSNFINFFSNSSDSTVYSGLVDELNVDNFLRSMASDVALDMWDDYWYGSNNFYLYSNTATGRFEWVPYDYDNTIGIDYFGVNWSTRHYDGWGNGGFGTTPAPLVDEVFQHSEWRRQYRRYLLQAADVLTDPTYQALIDNYHNQIAPYFDGTIESGGVTGTAQGQHVPYFENYNAPTTWSGSNGHAMGLKPYMDIRAASLISQLASNMPPDLPAVTINEVLASNLNTNADNFGEFDDWIELYNDEDTPIDLSGWYLSDDPSSPTMFQIPTGISIPANGRLLVWADDDLEQTAPGYLHANFKLDIAGETVILSQNEANGRVLVDDLAFPQLITDQSYGRYPDGSDTLQEFCVVTPLAANDNNTAPCNGGNPRTPPQLTINEFMADNASVLADDFGDFDDWIEIYNNENTAVDLGGLHLTDDLSNPTKWEFPAGTSIPAKGFLLVWADDEADESTPAVPHAAFKLGKDGEEIGLYDNDANSAQLIHSFAFGAQTTDLSEGLIPDGSGSLQPLANPTPGVSNTTDPNEAPTVNIGSPAPGFEAFFRESSIDISGTAADTDGFLTEVKYRIINGNGTSAWTQATNDSGTWTQWSFNAVLAVGGNLIEVQSFDNDGAHSPSVSRAINRRNAGEECDLLVLTPYLDGWGSTNAGGTFAGATRYAALGFLHDPASGWKTFAADFTGDNLTDMAVVTAGGEAWTATNLGNQTFGESTKQSSGYLNVEDGGWTALPGDFNGDGYTDLGQVTEFGALWVGYNDGAGNIPGPSMMISSGLTHDPANGYVINAADVNGDGRDDIVQLLPGGQFLVALATAGPGFQTIASFGYTGFQWNPASGYGIHFGDFNADGKDDVCQMTPFTDAWVALSNGTAFGAPTRWAWLGFRDNPGMGDGWWVFAGDGDGDGIDDLIQISEYGEAWIAESTGRGAFEEPYKSAQLGFKHRPDGPWQVYVSRNVNN